MKTTLTIRWDGKTPGLAEHRLSLVSWGDALRQLHVALRRTASSVLGDAKESGDYGAKGGRLRRGAEDFDVQLASLDAGCIKPTFVVGPPLVEGEDEQLAFPFPGFADRVLEVFLDHLDDERSGRLSSPRVRSFLRAIPEGVNVQEYEGRMSDGTVRRVAFATPNLAVEPVEVDPPRVGRVSGRISAVGFVEGREFVELLVKGDETIRAAAKPDCVDKALALRRAEVEGMLVKRDGKHSLLWVRAKGEVREIRPLEERVRSLQRAWAGKFEGSDDG